MTADFARNLTYSEIIYINSAQQGVPTQRPELPILDPKAVEVEVFYLASCT